MEWQLIVREAAAALLRRIVPALLGGLTLLLVDVGLLDATIGRTVDHAFRPSALSLTQAHTPGPRWALRAW